MRRPSIDTLAHPFEHTAVRVLEDLLVLHPQSDERVDIEEAPVAQVAVRAAPPCEAIVLQIEQRVQRVGISVHVGDGLIDGGRGKRVVVQKTTELLAEHGLVAMSSADAGTIGCGRPGELAEGVGEKRERIRARLPCGTTEQQVRASWG